jgi:hypothetical protein
MTVSVQDESSECNDTCYFSLCWFSRLIVPERRILRIPIHKALLRCLWRIQLRCTIVLNRSAGTPLRKRTIAGRVIITRGCVIITGGSVIIKANIIASKIIISNGIQTDNTRLLGITRKTTAYVITTEGTNYTQILLDVAHD